MKLLRKIRELLLDIHDGIVALYILIKSEE